MKSLVIMFLTLASFSVALGKSGHGHNHENAIEPPPHGGTLRDAPPYKAEAVISGETVKVYLYKKQGEITLGSINDGHGNITIKFDQIYDMHYVAARLPTGAICNKV